MSIQQSRDGLRWFCSRCEPRYEQWGPWGRPTTENIEAMREAERRHEWDWHTPQILKDAWGPAGDSDRQDQPCDGWNVEVRPTRWWPRGAGRR